MTTRVRLVIADDAQLIHRAVSHVVTECCPGVEIVEQAKDYAELFRAIREAQPDVVLMDLNMPCELESEQIRRKLASCCLIVMSAWFDEEAKVRARDYGASELLDKSTLAETLEPAISRCINRSKAATNSGT
jgi:DNA-binding NarL/FixJ family response regulator